MQRIFTKKKGARQTVGIYCVHDGTFMNVKNKWFFKDVSVMDNSRKAEIL